MYTEEDKKLANDILGLVRRNSMVKCFEMYREMRRIYGREDDAFSRKVQSIWKQLITLGLMIEAHGELTLTAEGVEAYDTVGGIEVYLKARKDSKQNDEDLKTSTIWHNRWSIAQIIVTIFCTITGFSIGTLLGYLIGAQG